MMADGHKERRAGFVQGLALRREVIILCVRWYLSYKLSSRDLVEMMSERGVVLSHTTILRWVQRFVPDFEKRWGSGATPKAAKRFCRKALNEPQNPHPRVMNGDKNFAYPAAVKALKAEGTLRRRSGGGWRR